MIVQQSHYSISNVGESIIAKHRSHATMVSYLTPPFVESRTRQQYQRLFDLLEQLRAGNDRQIGLRFKQECVRLNIHKDLQLDADLSRPYSEEEVIYIENFLAEIAQEKITGKLYTLGEAYSTAELEGTLLAMGAAPIAYKWAEIDRHKGRITPEQYESRAFVANHYLKPVSQWIKSKASLHHKIAVEIAEGDSVGLALSHQLTEAIDQLDRYRSLLLSSPEAEMTALIRALGGGYIAPSPGGDAVRSPNALPTGRNLFAINAETTPSQKAWTVGCQLAQNTIDAYLKKHGRYPTKVSYTFWAGEFIESEGATIAQALAVLGVEPLRDRHDRVVDLRLIPLSQLGRPRIDVVVQISGQLRDLATSRLILLNRAIEMASQAEESAEDNYVRSGSIEVERQLIAKGTPPAEARSLSTMRIFGGVNHSYGTGIKELVENGSAWETRSQIAKNYMENMGAIYGTEKEWGAYHQHLLSSALVGTDVVVQPRQNNTWGALSLDHVYEFMGGMSNAVEEVTGKAPEMYLADYRNRFNARMQGLKEAIGVESRTTILNPEYIKEKMKGGASSANTFAKTIRNAYGWEAMQPEALEDSFWEEVYEVYVSDEHQLGLQAYFEQVNPAALQEMSAVMLESTRKGMWQATDTQIATLSQLYATLTIKYGTSGSEFSDNNPKLQSYISSHLPDGGKAYQEAIRKEPSSGETKGVILKEERLVSNQEEPNSGLSSTTKVFIVVISLAIIFFFIVRRRRHKE